MHVKNINIQQRRPKRRTDYQLEMLDNELLLYNLHDTTIVYCNQTASLIWLLCDGRHTTDEIVAVLREAYPDAEETLAEDVTSTLRQLLDSGCMDLV